MLQQPRDASQNGTDSFGRAPQLTLEGILDASHSSTRLPGCRLSSLTQPPHRLTHEASHTVSVYSVPGSWMPSQISTVWRVEGRGRTGRSTSATTPCEVTVSQQRWTTSAGATATRSADRVSSAACSRGPGDARSACGARGQGAPMVSRPSTNGLFFGVSGRGGGGGAVPLIKLTDTRLDLESMCSRKKRVEPHLISLCCYADQQTPSNLPLCLFYKDTTRSVRRPYGGSNGQRPNQVSAPSIHFSRLLLH